MLTTVKPEAKGEVVGECVFMLLPRSTDLVESLLGVLISTENVPMLDCPITDRERITRQLGVVERAKR